MKIQTFVVMSLIKNVDLNKNNPGKSSTTKASEHFPSGVFTSTISSFKEIENKYDVYRDKDCKEKFCKHFKEYKIKINDFKKGKK